MISVIAKPNEIDHNDQSLEEQLALFFSKDFAPKPKNPALGEYLGQVFTSAALAEFMVSLLGDDLSPGCALLDPCIGPNTFFNALSPAFQHCNLKGIEIDKRLIGQQTRDFYSNANTTLVEGSFFDLDIAEKFDLIIQNPPYVRQELLVEGVNSKKNIKNGSGSVFSAFPAQSNLYIYFLLKSILHLKQDGIMVAVIYDSWLYSSFGNFLKESFLKLGYLDSIYHFKKSAFENAEVGATVIKFVKNKTKKPSISYYPLADLEDIKPGSKYQLKVQGIKQADLVATSFNHQSIIDFNSGLFRRLETIVERPVQRGTSAIVNRHFIHSGKEFAESKPIIKNVSQIKTYGVKTGDAYILAVNGSASKLTREYLEKVKQDIFDTPGDKNRAVKREIQNNKNWFKIKLKSSGNFIFNYYLRNNIDFLYNPGRLLSSDNFYSLDIAGNEMAYLALLNSSFTRLSVLSHSRTQGHGLRKIQVYEFKEVSVMDISKLSAASISDLMALGEKLMLLNRYQNEQKEIIEQIDVLLLKTYNEIQDTAVTLSQLNIELYEYLK